MVDEERRSIKQRLDDLEELEKIIKEKDRKGKAPKRSFMDKLSGKKSVKKDYQLPRKIRGPAKRKIKQNYAVVTWLKSNQSATMDWAPIVNDMVFNKHTGIYHVATANYMFNFNGKIPMLIIPEWSVEPLRPDKHIEETMQKGTYSLPQKVTINAMKLAALGPKAGFGGKTWLWIIIAIVGALYLLSQVLGGGT